MLWKLMAFIGCVSGLWALKCVKEPSSSEKAKDSLVTVLDVTLTKSYLQSLQKQNGTVIFLTYYKVLREKVTGSDASKLLKNIFSQLLFADCGEQDVIVFEYDEKAEKVVGKIIISKTIGDNIKTLLDENAGFLVLEN